MLQKLQSRPQTISLPSSIALECFPQFLSFPECEDDSDKQVGIDNFLSRPRFDIRIENKINFFPYYKDHSCLLTKRQTEGARVECAVHTVCTLLDPVHMQGRTTGCTGNGVYRELHAWTRKLGNTTSQETNTNRTKRAAATAAEWSKI